VPFYVEHALTAWYQGAVGTFQLLIVAAVSAGAIVVFHHAFRFGDRLAGDRPFTLPTCGTAPYEAGMLPLSLGGLAVTFLYLDGLDDALALFMPGSWIYLAVLAVCSVALALPCSALFNWRRRRLLATGHAAGTWLKARLLSGAFLVALAIADFAVLQWLGRGLVGFFPDLFALLLTYVLVADLWTEVRARWRAADGRELEALEVHQDVGDAIEAERRLRDDGQLRDVVLTGRRFRSLSYFLGPYIPLVVLGRRNEEPAD
jgi:hypothetical protein